MNLRKTLLPVLSLGLIIVACKKENNSSNTTPDPTTTDPCLNGQANRNGEIIEGQYIVTYNNNNQGRGMSAQTAEQSGEAVLMRQNVRAAALKKAFGGAHAGFVAELTDAEVLRLRSDDNVAIVEPDRIIALSTCFTVAAPHLVTWNIQRVGYGNGIGKTAWVIDTGIDFAHPDLTVDAARSKSFITGETSAADNNGHGTHVAGIIGGKNNNIGVLGVASGANLVALKVLGSDGEGTLSAVIQALAYVADHAAAGDVVNMSLGEELTSPSLNNQVLAVASRGIYISIAAGNESQPARLFSPANVNGTNIYTVSAVDSADNFASFSNFGNDFVDYAAPGVRILSTYTNGRYAWSSGTSMAAPHVAGLLLLKGRNISTSGTAHNDPDGVGDPIAHY